MVDVEDVEEVIVPGDVVTTDGDVDGTVSDGTEGGGVVATGVGAERRLASREAVVGSCNGFDVVAVAVGVVVEVVGEDVVLVVGWVVVEICWVVSGG